MRSGPRQSQSLPSLRRRPSGLGERLLIAKIEQARQMRPEERLLIALELSDLCHELRQACSAKR
jgi:hypothetical protein